MSERSHLEELQATVKSAKKVHTEKPTKPNLEKLQIAQVALASYYRSEQILDDKPNFASVSAVERYLKATGWKVSRATLQNHKRDGRISADSEGVYPLDRVLRYAKKELTPLDGEKRDLSEVEKKASAERERIEEQTLLTRARREELEKKLVSREKVDIANAGKATLLVNGGRNWCKTRAREIGEEYGIPADQLNAFSKRIEEDLMIHFDQYADDKNFWVEVLADD